VPRLARCCLAAIWLRFGPNLDISACEHHVPFLLKKSPSRNERAGPFRADSRLEQSIVAAIKAIRVAFLILHALTHAMAAAAQGSFRQAAEVLSIKQPIPQPASALSARGQ
jgi:hypothetical protein